MRVEQKNITISVFEVSNEKFEVLGQINQYTSLRWIEEYQDCGSFELWAPITEENSNYFIAGNVIWVEGEETAGIIEGVKETVDDNEEKVYDITGRMLSSLLTRRILWSTYRATNKPTYTVMRDMVYDNCINVPSGFERRVIPYLELGSISNSDEWGTLTIQRTYDEVLDALQDICNVQECGFSIGFSPFEKKLRFHVSMGVDRSIYSNLPPVILSSSMEDILNSTYYADNRDYKNVALVAGEGEGDERTITMAGDDTLVGYERRELYVDARDLQKDENDQTIKESDLENYTYDKDTIDEKIAGAGGQSSGHTIIDGEGEELEQRTGLQFIGATVTVEDDEENDVTKVTIEVPKPTSSGHIIEDGAGTEMAQRSKLQFIGAAVSDDEESNTTKINIGASSVYTPSIGTITTGAAGSSADVSVSVDDENKSVAYNFTIPRGDKGERGDKGDKGDTGATGQQGTQGPQGETGPKGDKGDKGDTGDSGTNGTDGVSPIVSITEIDGGHHLKITDVSGDKECDIMDGDATKAWCMTYIDEQFGLLLDAEY